MSDEVLWTPSPAQVEAANVTAFRRWLEQRLDRAFATYEELWRWSVDEPEEFWSAVWSYHDIQASAPYTRVLADARMPGARWFAGARLNFVDQVFRHAALATPAIIFDGEIAGEGVVSWPELRRQVAALTATLAALGVGMGDRVVAYLPNVHQSVVAFLAVASLGGIWSVSSPEMGAASVIDRFEQIDPKVMIACDGYRFQGAAVDRRDTVKTILDALPSIEALIWVPLLSGASLDEPALGGRSCADWADATKGEDLPLRTAQVPFDHPLWILYSSGTTGLPKPIVHGHGGVLLGCVLTTGVHSDLKPGERYLVPSSTNWMVWNIMVSALLQGTTICVFDGCISGPTAQRDWTFVWRFISRHRINHFGGGAALFTAGLKAGIGPADCGDLSALRSVSSSGSPLPSEAYRWIYSLRRDLWVHSVSGGTDICGAFVGGLPILPVRAGEMQCRILGVPVFAFDDDGVEVVDAVGELVCTGPLPSMPLFFWNDDGGKRYFDSYFGTFHGPHGENIWRHGDRLRLIPHPEATAAIIYGRSDSTINRQGIRIGTGELYRAVEAVPEILDSLVVDLEYLGRDSWLALFVVLADGAELDAALDRQIKRRISEALSPRHVPNEIVRVAAIPYTLTGKKLEVPIKKILLGQPPARAVNRDTVANPAAVDWFVAFADARNAARAVEA